jgi:hypothetical protein
MKKFILIIGAVIIAAAIAAGSFYGGMAYQLSQANATRDSFLRQRGLEGTGPGAGGFPGAGQDGASGQVKSIDGSTLTLSTAQNETKVTLSGDTVIQMSSEGITADLQPGQQVMVTGERDSDGNIAAIQILILADGAGLADPTP